MQDVSRHRPQKKWGQNFLRNQGAVRRIVEAVDGPEGELVLEIGPGEGVVTEGLLALGRRVLAIEIDPELVERLRASHGESSLEIREDDATTAPLPNEAFRAVGNLPYNVATPIIRRIITSPLCRRAVFMLQKEVADRTTAKVGDEAYGFLTMYVKLFATARQLMTLEPGSFHPAPKVRSAVVVFEPSAPSLLTSREEVIDLLSASFRMRRKKLSNNLNGYRGLTKQRAVETIAGAGLGPDARAEELNLEQIDRLASVIRRDAGAKLEESLPAHEKPR